MSNNGNLGRPRWIPETDERNELSTEKFTRKFAEKAADRHMLELLVREVAQNSIDAHAGDEPVRLHFTIQDREGAVWEEIASGEGGILRGKNVTVLTVSDRGTVGLQGPVLRTGAAAANPERNNYLNFVSTTASSGKSATAGGSYSLGRSLVYLLSESRTVLIDTVHCGEDGKLIRRIIGMRLLKAEDLKRLNEKRGNAVAASGPVWWCLNNKFFPLEGELNDPAALVNIVARQLGLEDSFADGETGTDLHIVDFRLPGEDGEQDHSRIARLLHAAAACNLYQAVCDNGEMKATIESVTCRGGGQTLILNEAAIDPRTGAADLWPVRHMVRAYLDAKPGGGKVACGRESSQPSRSGAALAELSEMQPFRSLKEQGDDLLDPAHQDGVSFIVASREPTRIVLDIWQKQPNHSNEKWELEPRPGFWSVGCIIAVDPVMCSKLRDAEDEAHTRWQKRGRNISEHLGDVHRHAATIARELGVKRTETPETASSRELTELGFAIGRAFQVGGQGHASDRPESGPSGPGGGGGRIRPSSSTLVNRGGSVYHQYVYDGLVVGARYTVRANEYNLAKKKGAPPKAKQVLNDQMQVCSDFIATGPSQTLLIKREDRVSIALKVERV